MTDKHYFTVSSDIGDRDEYICESFEEAREYLSTVVGWCGPGGGSITEIDKHFHCVRSWHYNHNEETSHYDFSDCYNNSEESKDESNA